MKLKLLALLCVVCLTACSTTPQASSASSSTSSEAAVSGPVATDRMIEYEIDNATETYVLTVSWKNADVTADVLVVSPDEKSYTASDAFQDDTSTTFLLQGVVAGRYNVFIKGTDLGQISVAGESVTLQPVTQEVVKNPVYAEGSINLPQLLRDNLNSKTQAMHPVTAISKEFVEATGMTTEGIVQSSLSWDSTDKSAHFVFVMQGTAGMELVLSEQAETLLKYLSAKSTRLLEVSASQYELAINPRVELVYSENNTPYLMAIVSADSDTIYKTIAGAILTK